MHYCFVIIRQLCILQLILFFISIQSILKYCHIVQEKLQARVISPLYVPTCFQLADVLTMALGKDQFVTLHNKLGLHDIYFLT
jgi:hypothetical protein